MLQATDPQYLSVILWLLKWLLGASVVGFLASIAALYKFPPDVAIVRVADKHPRLAFESRLVIKNIGKLPARTIWANVYACAFKSGSIKTSDMTLVRNGRPITKLSAGESTEIPALPQAGMPPGLPLERCEYRLVLEYYTPRLFFYRKKLATTWKIELRNFGNDFKWQFTKQ